MRETDLCDGKVQFSIVWRQMAGWLLLEVQIRWSARYKHSEFTVLSSKDACNLEN